MERENEQERRRGMRRQEKEGEIKEIRPVQEERRGEERRRKGEKKEGEEKK